MRTKLPPEVTCPNCGRTEVQGSYCSWCLTPTGGAPHESSPAPANIDEGRMQRCLRCGTDEYAGAYCTWCRGADYELVEHRHISPGNVCPLGPYLSPSGRPDADQRKDYEANLAAWLASDGPAQAEQFVVRRWLHTSAVG